MRSRFTILTLLLALLATSCQRQSADPPVRPAAARTSPGETGAAAPGRRVFPYSVVSGGVTTPAEMAAAVQQDSVVREHYSGLQPAAFRPEVLKEDRKGYVSYRIRDKVYWSRRLMTIKKGELVLTDGESLLRGRCGNRISPIALSPVAPEGVEPTEAVLDSSQDSRLLAGIPPIPVSSPVGGQLKFDRSFSENPSAGLLLLPPDSEMGGLIVPWANLVSPGGFWIAGANAVGGGGGGVIGGGGGGGPAPVQPGVPPPGVEPGTIPPVVVPPPTVVPSVPPRIELPIPPETIAWLPPGVKPPAIEPPNVWLPPATSFPPLSTPPGSVPPGVVPPPDPPSTPPTNNPPGPPPGTGEPPPSNPPTVSDPPPFFPPPDPPEEDNPVPEPATILLAAGALALLAGGRYMARRRG